MKQEWWPSKTDGGAAPALTRGVAVLARLWQEGGGSLEQLAQATEYPKASLLRILQTLSEMGAISWNRKTKQYTPLVRIVSVAGRIDHQRQFQQDMSELSEKVGHTAEAYRFGGGELVMVDRWEPESPGVRAVARVGFVRNLKELDSLSLMYRLRKLPKPAPRNGCWYWNENAERVKLSAKEVVARINEVTGKDVVIDPGVNGNGVRRYSIWLGPPWDMIISIAEVVPRGEDKYNEKIIKGLKLLVRRWGNLPPCDRGK